MKRAHANLIIISIYVDDLLVTRNDKEFILYIFSRPLWHLNNEFFIFYATKMLVTVLIILRRSIGVVISNLSSIYKVILNVQKENFVTYDCSLVWIDLPPIEDTSLIKVFIVEMLQASEWWPFFSFYFPNGSATRSQWILHMSIRACKGNTRCFIIILGVNKCWGKEKCWKYKSPQIRMDNLVLGICHMWQVLRN